jgi:hypothetical protein
VNETNTINFLKHIKDVQKNYRSENKTLLEGEIPQRLWGIGGSGGELERLNNELKLINI